MNLKDLVIGQVITAASNSEEANQKLFTMNLKKAIEDQRKTLEALLGRSLNLHYDGFTKDGGLYHLGLLTPMYRSDFEKLKLKAKVKGWKWEKDDGEDWINNVTKSGSNETASIHVEHGGTTAFIYILFDFEKARKLFKEPKLSPISVGRELKRWIYYGMNSTLSFQDAKQKIERRETKKEQKSLDILMKSVTLKKASFIKTGNVIDLQIEIGDAIKEVIGDIKQIQLSNDYSFNNIYDLGSELKTEYKVNLEDIDFKKAMISYTLDLNFIVIFESGKKGRALFKVAVPDNAIRREAEEENKKRREERERQQSYNRNSYSRPPKDDPYKVLEIPESSDFNAIKKAYRTQMMKHHPDRGGSEDQAKKINDAFEYLERVKGFKATASEVLASMGLRDIFKRGSSMNLKDMKIGQVVASTVETAGTTFQEYKKLHPNTKKTYNDPMFSNDPALKEYNKHSDNHHESFKKIMTEKDKHGSMDHFYTNDPVKYRELHDEKDKHHAAREKAYKKLTGQK